MSRESAFSLSIMVLIMALLAIFIGYLLGNWIIQFVTGDTTDTHQVLQNKIVEEEIIEDKQDSSGVPEQQNAGTPSSQEPALQDQLVKQQLTGEVYVVQVGAFNSYKNALILKGELEENGFQAVITEGVPYRVQLGATNKREEAENTEKLVESFGYDAFITH